MIQKKFPYPAVKPWLPIVLFALLFIPVRTSHAEIPSFQGRQNRCHLRLESRFMEKDHRTDLWSIDKENLVDLGIELGYERILFGHLGVEVNMSVSRSVETWGKSFFFSLGDDMELLNVHGSQALKYYLPLGQKALFFTGAGIDVYCDNGEITMDVEEGVDYRRKADSLALGGHVQVGAEYLIIDDPVQDGWLDLPVSLEIKYNYYWIGVDATYNRVVSSLGDVETLFSQSPSSQISGHMITLGLKWHF